jgi:hypothetical protein
MKKFALLIVAAFALVAFSGVATAQDKASPEEAAFLKDGPKLYTMDAALVESAKTGKPVVCWMGKHLFADERARALSKSLGDTTIQAAMDSDGSKDDQVAPLRVKFSNNGYKDAAKTFYIPVGQFADPWVAETILSYSRGGSGK